MFGGVNVHKWSTRHNEGGSRWDRSSSQFNHKDGSDLGCDIIKFCARPRKHTCPVTRTVLPAYEVLDLLRPHSIVTRIYADTDNFNKT